MTRAALLAVALIFLGSGCYPDPNQAARVAVEFFDPPPEVSAPIPHPHFHDVLPDVSFAATVTCPVALLVTSEDDEPFDYLVTYGPEQMPLGVPTILGPGETATVDLADAVGHRTFLVLNNGIALYIDVTAC